jgi:hypothetical protein
MLDADLTHIGSREHYTDMTSEISKKRGGEGLLATIIIVVVVLIVLGWFIR